MAVDPSTRRAVFATILGLGAGVLLMLGIRDLGTDSVEVDQGLQGVPLESVEWQAGPAVARAEGIDDDGPILFPDVAGGDLDVWLQHLGDDAYVGWYAFSARPAEVSDRACFAEWQADDPGFVDTCSGAAHLADGLPADGTGAGDVLTQYPVRIHDGQLRIDLGGELEDEPGRNRISGSTPD